MKTKAFILIGLMALLLLTACSSGSDLTMPESGATTDGNGSGTPSEPHAVGFVAAFANDEGGAAASRTRGANRRTGEEEEDVESKIIYGRGEFTTDSLQKSGFGVYCWYTGSSEYIEDTDIRGITQTVLMLNQRVEYKDGLWTYSPSKYWPLKDTELLTFRAYAPYVSYQLQTMTTTGLPLLPVVVTKDDYHNGKQHDPLWGTSKHRSGIVDEKTEYGEHYNNYTYVMSGDNQGKDAHDGIVYWYFHHGMSKLMFAVSVIQDPGCQTVTIHSIQIEGLYTQGLLDLNSPTTDDTDKPYWYERSGNMSGEEGAVKLNGATEDASTWIPGDLAPSPKEDPEPVDYKPYPFVIKTSTTEATGPDNLLRHGLLIIPRDFRSPNDPMTITISYTIDDETEPQVAKGTIKENFEGNTAYTLNLSLTPSTRGLEITMVQSAFTGWTDGGTMERWVYNW